MIYLVFSFQHSSSYRDLNVSSFLGKLQAHLPIAYKKSKMSVWLSPNNKFLLVSWGNSNIPVVEYKSSYAYQSIIKHPLKGYIISSGHTHEGMINSKNNNAFPYIFELMKVSGSDIKLSDSPGGSGTYSWISPNESTLVSWNTQPPAFPLFIGKNSNDFCVVGNRVLLVMMASYLSETNTRFNSFYINSYIPTGYALDGDTLYENVKMLPANKSVTCKDGKWNYTDYPLNDPEIIPQEIPLEEKSSLLASALIKSLDVLHDFNSSVLWLSGGKDSRTLAAILSHLKLKSQAISFGSTEFECANPVAEICKVNYQIHDMSVISNPIEAAIISNKVTEGLGVSTAHQFNFQYLPTSPDLPNIHGHGHLLRGGFARTMNAEPEKISLSLKNAFFSKFTSNKGNSKILNDLKTWENTRVFNDIRDKLYWANHDLRLGSYTAPQVMDLTGKSFMLYPLLDEKVARIASGLFMFDKVSERVLFGAIKQLCQELSGLPLYDEGWRFDRSPDKIDFLDSNHNFQEGFSKRQPKPTGTIHGSNLILEGNISSSQSLVIKNQFILDSSIYTEIKPLLQPEVISLIESRALSNKEQNTYLSSLNSNERFTLEVLLNRVFIASTLYDISWITHKTK